jgi:hypothetical protein
MKGRYVNAAESEKQGQVCFYNTDEVAHENTCEDTHETAHEDTHYSRQQDNNKSINQEKEEKGQPTPTVPAQDGAGDKPAISATDLWGQAKSLAGSLFKWLGEPEKHKGSLRLWSTTALAILNDKDSEEKPKYSYKRLLRSMHWALKVDTFWPERLYTMEHFSNSVDHIVKKADVYYRKKKQTEQEQSPKQASAPSRYNTSNFDWEA